MKYVHWQEISGFEKNLLLRPLQLLAFHVCLWLSVMFGFRDVRGTHRTPRLKDMWGGRELLTRMDVVKVGVPYLLWMCSHEFEDPMSTPHYLSLLLILLVKWCVVMSCNVFKNRNKLKQGLKSRGKSDSNPSGQASRSLASAAAANSPTLKIFAFAVLILLEKYDPCICCIT